MVAPARLRVVRCGGGNHTGARAVFSADSKYLLCASGDFVKVYSVVTEEMLRLIGGHADRVTGIQLNPHNHMQLYSSSLDGTIKLWDFMDGIAIKTFTVGSILVALYAPPAFEDSVFVVASQTGNRGPFQLISVKLTKAAGQVVEAKELSVVLSGVDSSPKCIAFGREGKYVVSVKQLDLTIYFFKKKMVQRISLRSSKVIGGSNQFLCVACHPTEDCIATGHTDGKIRIWYACLDSPGHPINSWNHVQGAQCTPGRCQKLADADPSLPFVVV